MKIKETEIFQRLENRIGTQCAIRFIFRLYNCEYTTPEKNELQLNNINAEEFIQQVANGNFDHAIVNAASEYVNKTQADRRHRLITTVIGFNFPMHELVSDEKKTLTTCRTEWKKAEEKRARYIENRGVFDTLTTKRDAQRNTLAECNNAIKSLDVAKVAKENPARIFMQSQIKACESEIKALTAELLKCYNEYMDLDLSTYIPDDIIREFSGITETPENE